MAQVAIYVSGGSSTACKASALGIDGQSGLRWTGEEGLCMLVDPHDEIAALEQEIEVLVERVEQCRKVSLAATAVIGVGGVLLILTLIGILGRSPGALVAGIAALLGGVALYGSNRSTLDEVRRAIRKLESRRAALIGAIEFRLVPN
jgi:hypothetical protein